MPVFVNVGNYFWHRGLRTMLPAQRPKGWMFARESRDDAGMYMELLSG